jgi:hypothetical protein
MAGSQNDNPFDAPIGQLNNLKSPDVQKVVGDDLYSVLGATASESLKPKEIIGQGNLKGIVIGILETHRSLKDRELKELGTANEPPPEDAEETTIQNQSSSPYGYIVNVPELCSMLPTVPATIAAPNFDKVVKAYRDNGFVFRCRPNHTAELANIGDTVQVNFQNPTNFSSGYYVGLISRAGDHPGLLSTSAEEGELVEVATNLSNTEYAGNKLLYLDLVDAAKNDVKDLKCIPEEEIPKTLGSGGKRLEKLGGTKWYTKESAVNLEGGFFLPDGSWGSAGPYFNPKLEKAFLLVRNLLAQDPEILRYMAESYLVNPQKKGGKINYKRARLSSWRRMCFSHRVKKGKCAPNCYMLPEDIAKGGGQCLHRTKKNSKGKPIGCASSVANFYNAKEDCFKGNIGNHGLGAAIDINPSQNPYSKNFKTDHPPQLQAIFELCGFRLGTEFDKPDTQHFDFVGDLDAVNEQWDACEDKLFYEDNWVDITGGGSAPNSRALLQELATDGVRAGPRSGNTLQSKVLNKLNASSPDDAAESGGGS